jgi:hypothetical protein
VLPAWSFVLVLAAGHVLAKPPTLTGLEPSGIRQGSATLAQALGTFDPWPLKSWTDDPGLVIAPDPEKGMVWIEATSKARPGLHWIRLFNDEGASQLRPFLVGGLPEVREIEPNDDPARAQPIDRAAVMVNGKLARNNDVDGFGVTLKKGEILVASLEANRLLGSPMDGLLQVARPDGIVLAENDDDDGRDPQLVFQAPSDGRYIVRTFAFPATPDSRIGYAGGPNYLYRLTLTTRAFVDYPFPLARARGGEATGPVRVEGWNIDENLRTHEARSIVDGESLLVSDPKLANIAHVRLVDHPALEEVEPNPPDAPQRIEPPLSLSGRIAEGRDTDAYLFSAKKGERLLIQVESRGLGQPLDAALRVLDAKGQAVAEADDSSRNDLDVELVFNPPSDGPYRAVVRDLNRQGGPRAAYLLTIAPPTPDYRLSLDNDRFTMTRGKPLEVTVKVSRTNGFEGAVEITAEGLPEGVSAKPATSDGKGDSSRSVKLTLEAAAGEVVVNGAFQLVGRSPSGKGPIRVAAAKVDGFESPTAHPWVTVLKGQPKTLGK